MHRKLLVKKTAIFSIILIILAFFATLPVKVSAQVSISNLSPSEGPVRTVVSLIGQISQANGSYNILFDDKFVKNGSAVDQAVSDVFTVPNATFGDHQVKLQDITTGENSTTLSFSVQSQYIVQAVKPISPVQLQEGANVTVLAIVTGGNASIPADVTVTVKDPANATHSTNLTIPVGAEGYGEANKTYPTAFDGNPHTFYIGTYNLALNVSDETFASGNFTVGLTDATEYHRFQTVYVQALNYTSNDVLKVVITHGGDTVFESAPKNASGPTGVIAASWMIPANASLGSYRVSIVNVTPLAMEKPVPDNQTFKIVSQSFACEVKTFNLDGEPVANIVVEANNTFTYAVTQKTTGENGLASFFLEATNYAFTAFLNSSRVSEPVEISLPKNLTGSLGLNITCSLANIKVAVRDVEDNLIPFVEVVANFTYTTRTNTTVSKTVSAETNLTGIAILRNLFININYTVNTSRYGYTFDTTMMNLMSTSWVNTTCPTLELIIKTLDRNRAPLQNAMVRVYDLGTGLGGLVEGNTSANGEVAFNLIFGKYIVVVNKDGYLLNETTTPLINLTHSTNFVVYCKLYTLTLDVSVLDYFGQGIPNADVTIEREGAVLSSGSTGGDGVVQFAGLVGGNYRVLVYIAQKPYEIAAFYLEEPKTVTFKIGGVISIGGLLIETSHFITIILIILLVVAFLLAFIYRRRKLGQKKE